MIEQVAISNRDDQPSGELITIEPANALALFTTPNAIDPLLARIRSQIDAFVADISTASGRKAVASMAYKVARTKTYLDDAGKKLADQQKEVPKKIDATRAELRKKLDVWKDEVRAPLTAWEKEEDDRVAHHKAMLNRIEACGNGTIDGAPQPFGVLFCELEQKLIVDQSYEEFEADAHRLKAAALAKLKQAFSEHEKREAEKAELERLRADAAAREQKDREDRIARDAAEKAKRDAEAKAEAERKIAEDVANRERDAAARRELELKLHAEQAERRALEAEANAKRDAQAKADSEAAETARREADAAHRAKINKSALDAFVAAGIDAATAKHVVTLIAQKGVPNVHISY